ncbi:MAG: YgcG family protein, partial [Thermoanaerobaculia bacterium]
MARTRGRVLARPLLLLFLAASAWGAVEDQIPDAPKKFVTDRAGVLGGRADELSRDLEQFERDTSNQILVWIEPRVPENFTMEDFTGRAAEKWGAGQGATDNGAVLFVFPEDRKLRIEVGYGLEGAIPDATANRIIDDEIVPHFRGGDYAAGVEAGIRALKAAARGEYKGTGTTVNERSRSRSTGMSNCLIPALFFGVFFILPYLLRRKKSWRTYGGRGWWTGTGGFGGGWGGGSWGGGGGFS